MPNDKTNKDEQTIRSHGQIRFTDKRGYAYIPKILRKEIGFEELGPFDSIPFVLDANVVLLIRKDATLEEILGGLDVLKRDLKLRVKRGNHSHMDNKTQPCGNT